MKVSGVVVSHGHARELEQSLPALAPQVDELVVIANVPGSVGAVPDGARVLESPRPRTFAANVNAGVAATTGEYVVLSNPDAVPEAGAVAALVRFADEHPRAGLVGPLVFWPDGTWQPSLRRFPDVLGTLWRRTPLRLLRPPYEHQVSHYGTRPTEPRQGDWLLGGACLLMRRRMLKTLSPANVFSSVLDVRDFAERLPGRMNRILDALSANDLRLKIEVIDHGSIIDGFQKVANRIALGLVLAALIVGAAMLMRVQTPFTILGYPGFAMLLFLAAAGGGFWMAWTILAGDVRTRTR